jgi:hypothetical protein
LSRSDVPGLKEQRRRTRLYESNRLIECRNENLAIADLAGLGGLLNGFHRTLDLGGRDGNLDFAGMTGWPAPL